MSNQDVGLFFGAGAEVDYGLPLGGTFAVDIFREDTTPDKERLRTQLEDVDRRSPYGEWLPDRNRIYTFGKREAGNLLESTIEQRKKDLIRFMASFEDEAAAFTEEWEVDHSDFENSVNSVIDRQFGQVQFGDVTLNEVLQDGGVNGTEIFSSAHFSALLEAVDQTGNTDLRDLVMAFVELLVACHGKTVVENLNLTIFDETRGLNFLEELPQMFRFELETVARDTLSLIFDADRDDITDPSTDMEHLQAFGLGMLERLLGQCFDYRALIDAHFRYLYTPEAHWAKFTRIATFLFTVRRYIEHQQPDADTIRNGPGYYHDLPNLESEGFDVRAVGTSNYNTFLEKIIGDSPVEPDEIRHLNGALEQYYDPYLNKLVEHADIEDIHDDSHVLVPFMLTQSGTKPMTAVEMSERYVDLYRKYLDCDAVIVVGFGFNADDSHINGIFRSLAEENIDLLAFEYDQDGSLSRRQKREASANLRLQSNDQVTWCGIDDDRQSDGVDWWERVAHELD